MTQAWGFFLMLYRSVIILSVIFAPPLFIVTRTAFFVGFSFTDSASPISLREISIFFSEFVAMDTVCFFGVWPSALINCIFCILASGTQKKMFWVYAFGIVAAMTNIKSLWDWSVVNLPCGTMTEHLFPVDSKKAIPLSFAKLWPFNASGFFVRNADRYFFFESFYKERSFHKIYAPLISYKFEGATMDYGGMRI